VNLATWTELALAGIRDGIAPAAMQWADDGLFQLSSSAAAGSRRDVVVANDLLLRPSIFSKLARSVACHRHPSRWDALYATLWRIVRGEPELLTVATDPLVHRLVQMHRNVKRASHKMKAFVRFRLVAENDRYVAWFEPAHDVVERTAPFFVRRFASMQWSILTPDRCAHWDCERLRFTEGVSRSQAPAGDGLEDMWRTYYANIFNPARLNGRAMRAEMPRKYWHNLPEAALIADLRAAAPARVREMLARVHDRPEAVPEDVREVGEEPAKAPLSPLDVSGDWDPLHDPGVSTARAREVGVRRSEWCRHTVNSTPIDFGVAGWTDPTILADGVFYPSGCNTPEARLRYYASRFSMVEVDSTYYSLPSRSTAAAWAARTPLGFQFDIKAHALMTGHPTEVKRLPDWIRRALPKALSTPRIYSSDLPNEIIEEVWTRFRSALDPLRTAGKLGAIMLQFPRWFEPSRASADVLRRARERLGDDLGTIEFRNRRWMEGRIAERTLCLLRDLGLAYVVVDAPQGMESSMPRTVAVTDARLAVFRLHGRRVATWEAKNDPVTERYRYLYDRDELQAWLPAMYETAFSVARVHVTFNNNHANYATTNAAEMADLFAAPVPPR
jgi:probable DNA metabolism protein